MVVDADIKGYFDNIDQDLLLDFITEEINDGWVLRIIKSWLAAGVMTEDGIKETPKKTPQGGTENNYSSVLIRSSSSS